MQTPPKLVAAAASSYLLEWLLGRAGGGHQTAPPTGPAQFSVSGGQIVPSDRALLSALPTHTGAGAPRTPRSPDTAVPCVAVLPSGLEALLWHLKPRGVGRAWAVDFARALQGRMGQALAAQARGWLLEGSGLDTLGAAGTCCVGVGVEDVPGVDASGAVPMEPEGAPASAAAHSSSSGGVASGVAPVIAPATPLGSTSS